MLCAFSFLKNNCHILHIRTGVSVLFLPGTNNFLPYLSNLYNFLGGELGIAGTIKWNSIHTRIYESTIEDEII